MSAPNALVSGLFYALAPTNLSQEARGEVLSEQVKRRIVKEACTLGQGHMTESMHALFPSINIMTQL